MTAASLGVVGAALLALGCRGADRSGDGGFLRPVEAAATDGAAPEVADSDRPSHDAGLELDAPGASDVPGDATGPRPFALGVEYTETGLAAPFGAAGVRWAKTRLEAFRWGAIERQPGGAYDWRCTDALVSEYQAAGMTNLLSYLSPQASWGSLSAKDPAPRPEHFAAYRAWVRALVERYDGDGRDDMPGLRAPIRHWVVGGEWTGFWGSGDADAYLRVLEATRAEARAAFADVVLGAIPFMMFDVFAGDPPTDAQIAARLQDPPPAWRNSTAGMRRILDRGELFDFVDVHSLGDYSEIAPTLGWLRAEMRRRGYDRPIWIDDAFPMSFLVTWRPVPNVGWPPVHPVTPAQEKPLYDLLSAVARNEEPAASRGRAWIEAEVAKGVVKKAITALAEGAAGIQIGNTEDWMHDSAPGLRHATVNLIGAAALMGLVDVTHIGYEPCDRRTAGAARPGLGALRLLLEKLGPDLAVERVALPALPPDPVDVVQLVFRRGDRYVAVLWTEPRRLLLPGEVDVPVVSHAFVPSARVRVTTLATARGAEPRVEDLESQGGGFFHVPVTTTPVFVEPLP